MIMDLSILQMSDELKKLAAGTPMKLTENKQKKKIQLVDLSNFRC